ncbi:TetR/AcrR family transcriptional regulator [Mycolicibacterium celeriflavum]|uniref:TetR family transcriptional regulator n=2 Tax=Mycolicibacterium celeriflavum TaxID=1249101 RepID=A0A1X0BVK0_MYCCF|nr:TetR/AcrR family transcriptional regulator [Mycolicibacterium celeriflavum]MCV7237479.1 TetR/AcrR family transcriptional regulator [Mycolicibacterium celeriflavum]ORA47825.1 TetR family transcriptional regulator [Mycolicibacterium celeriflavum]BBY45885.1 TetR family transcriptional regulator [Mycolicibacterium celeriflavum]
MARSAADRKAATRRRIIETASERFKQDGIDGSGIATLMSDAGLTNGAFYAHFSSKDDLVANVVADQLRAQHDNLSALPPGKAALEGFVRDYLSPHHRDHPGTGCPNAALLDEIGRCDDGVRDAYTEGIQSIVDVIAAHLSPRDPSAARPTAVGLFTVLVATLQLSRAVTDRELSDGILASGILNAQLLLDYGKTT